MKGLPRHKRMVGKVPSLFTTLGPMHADALGMILPHEHIFTDLRLWDQPGYGQAEIADVVA